MKKQLSGILAMLMCLTCFSGCDVVNSTKDFFVGGYNKVEGWVGGLFGKEEKVNEKLKDAATFLKNSLLQDKNTVETRADYELERKSLGFDVTWSVTVTEGDQNGVVVLDYEDEAKVIIDVDEAAKTDILYTLTATLKDAEGLTETISVNRKVLKAGGVPELLKVAPEVGVAYKLYVYQGNLKQDFYFTGSMDGHYFGTTQDSEAAADVYAEYVEGSTSEYYLYMQDKDGVKTYITLERGPGDDGKDHDNLNLSTTEKSAFRFDENLQTLVRDVNSSRTCYMGTFNTLDTIRASSITYATEPTNFVGGLATLVDRETATPEKKVSFEKEALAIKTKFNGSADSFRLPTKGSRYTDVQISWEVEENAIVSLNSRKDRLNVAAYTEKSTVKLTATIKVGEVIETQEFTLNLSLLYTTPEEIVNAAYALASGESLDDPYTLTGVITKITEAYTAQYGNITAEIQVGDMTDKPILCYRIKGTGADVVKVGDTITVTGIITNFNGTIEFTTGSSLDSYVIGEGNQGGGDQGGEDNTDPSDTIPAGAIVENPVAGVEYYLYAPNSNGNFYFNGTESSGRINGATDKAVKVVLEATDVANEFYLYFINNGVKTYVNGCTLSSTDNDGNPKADTSDFALQTAQPDNVWILDVAKKAFYTKNSNRMIGTDSSKDFTNFSTYAMSNYGSGSYAAAWFSTGTVGGNSGEVTPPAEDDDTTTTLTAVVPEAGKAYIFGMTQGNLQNKVYYLAGGMNGYYMETTDDASKAIATYIEATEGGYYFYTLNTDGSKLYINMVVSDTHVNGAYEATASTVYTIDQTNKTLIAVVNDADYWFGTRNDKTYTTMGPCAVSYAGFYAQFYAEVEGDDNQGGSGTVTPPAGDDDTTTMTPEEIVNAAYALGANEDLGTYTLTGVVIEISSAYNSEYSNVSVVIQVGNMVDKPITCYRMKGTGADVIKVGDTITCTGTLTNYVGDYGSTIEFKSGCTLDSYVVGEAPVVEGVVLSFADTTARTQFTTEVQVWEANGITLTNTKGSSNIADYSNPARFYKGSKVVIEFDSAVTKVVFVVAGYAEHKTAIKDTLEAAGYTVTVEGNNYIVEFIQAVTKIELTMAAQGRLAEIQATFAN